MQSLKMLDLFSGLGGASEAMIVRGWNVIRIDNVTKFKPDIVADLIHFRPKGNYDLIWASPPCTDFARWAMPESFGPRRIPHLDLFKASIEIIQQLKPRFWIIENVRGSRMWVKELLGVPTQVIGPYNFWSNLNIPKLKREEYKGKGKWKLPPSPDRPALRSKIPYGLSNHIANLVEKEIFADAIPSVQTSDVDMVGQ